jgi:hypothetical protein
LYAAEYDAFRSYSMNSLDIVRPYFLALNFPIFVHTYIGLIRTGSSGKEARAFFDSASGPFLENYYDEIMALSLVTEKGMLASEDFVSSNPFV